MKISPGSLRLVTFEGEGYPHLLVQDAEGRWLELRGVSRIEVVSDGRDEAGVPRLRVEFCPFLFGTMDLRLREMKRIVFGLAGVDDALIEAAKQHIAALKSASSG